MPSCKPGGVDPKNALGAEVNEPHSQPFQEREEWSTPDIDCHSELIILEIKTYIITIVSDCFGSRPSSVEEGSHCRFWLLSGSGQLLIAPLEIKKIRSKQYCDEFCGLSTAGLMVRGYAPEPEEVLDEG